MQSIAGSSEKAFPVSRLIVGMIGLFIFLLSCCLLCTLAFPSWLIRLAGVQTTAIAQIDKICSYDNEEGRFLYSFSYLFTGPQGQHYRITREDQCGGPGDGVQIMVWYTPNDPIHLLLGSEVTPLYIFSGLGILANLLGLFLMVVASIPRLARKWIA